jgi:hypothetical protein
MNPKVLWIEFIEAIARAAEAMDLTYGVIKDTDMQTRTKLFMGVGEAPPACDYSVGLPAFLLPPSSLLCRWYYLQNAGVYQPIIHVIYMTCEFPYLPLSVFVMLNSVVGGQSACRGLVVLIAAPVLYCG